MTKEYTVLGLMSGTSGDGVDASIIKSDGENKYEVILNKYFEYDKKLYKDFHELRKVVNSLEQLNSLKEKISKLEKDVTLFNAKVLNNFQQSGIDFVGFHGQTIYHSAIEKTSKQLGDGKLLSKLSKQKIVYNFRQNDLENGGQGAPLAPIFHKLLIKQNKITLPVNILNIGGISNVTSVNSKNEIFSSDIGPGNCLIDEWIRFNSKNNYDYNGEIAKSGTTNSIILNQALDIFYNNPNQNRTFDVKDFDLSFVRGLSLADGANTLTEYTSEIISKKLSNNLTFLCGGGRKNKFLVKRIKEKTGFPIKLIDDLNIDGDFVESQAFAYLAIRSYLKLPISFPETTGCKKPSTGGQIIKI